MKLVCCTDALYDADVDGFCTLAIGWWPAQMLVVNSGRGDVANGGDDIGGNGVEVWEGVEVEVSVCKKNECSGYARDEDDVLDGLAVLDRLARDE